MISLKLCTPFVLSKCAYKMFDRVPNEDSQAIRFELENLECPDGFQTEILVGHLVYDDEDGNCKCSKPLLLKIFPEAFLREIFTEVTFQNEIFAYNKILPYYTALDDSILDLFAKFFYARLDFDEKEDGVIIIENLTKLGYRSMNFKIFLDLEHLLLVMKKLGEFHAYSYQAKKQNPEEFYSMVNCLIQTQRCVTKKLPGFNHRINEYYCEILSRDVRYTKKVNQIRRLMEGDADEFVTKILDSRNEPVAVLCHGDFLRNNILCKYDAENNPVHVKFVDLGNMTYTTPIIDLGSILYMNTDQSTREKYWDLLIDTYYDSLRNKFPNNDLVPSKNEILSEFKHCALQPYLMVASFIPWMMAKEESNDSPNWFKDLFEPDFVEYKDLPIVSIPGHIRDKVLMRMCEPHRDEKVLDVLRDIIDRGFV